ERDEKDAARRHAEATRDRALATLDAMTSNVVGEALTQQKFITPEQKQFLTTALDFYRELLKEKGSDEATRKRLAAAAHRVGMIEARLGRHAEAAAIFGQAGELYAQLTAEFPAVAAHRLGLAQNLNFRGDLLRLLGKPKQAENQYRAAQDI